MTIYTGVSAQLRRPQTFHAFTYRYKMRALVPLPLRLALVGVMASTGTASAGTVYEVTDAEQTDRLFGESSELAIMCRMALDVGGYLSKGPAVYACPLAEPGTGAADVRTLTVTGTASANANAIIRVAGRTFYVGIRSGDTAATVAAAIAAALLERQAELPVRVSVATTIVTLTAPHKGENGADVAVSVEQSAAGITITPATSAAGSGVADITTALDALGALPFDAIAIANHKAADITDINADLATRWAYNEKRWRWYFVGERGTIGTAAALATAANHQAVIVASYEGCPNTPGEIATALAFAAFSRERPNAGYNGLKIPLYPPDAATVYTPTEVETAIAAGLTPLTAELDPITRNVIAGVSKIERLVTTKTTENGATYEILRDLAVSRTGVWIAQQIDTEWAARTAEAASGDGMLATDNMIGQVRDMIEAMLRAAADDSIIRDVEADLARLLVERDAQALGRFNADVPYTVVVPLGQIAFMHRVQVG